jgi:HEAT repeat protein
MPVSEKLKELVAQMPDPDNRAMYCTDIDKEKIEGAVAEIAKGGKESIQGVIEMLGEPGSDADVKPHYALHCVANHVLKTKDENARRQFAETVAAQLNDERPKAVQAFLCQELQWAGRKEAVAALGKLLTDEELVEPATLALVAIRDGAAEQFRAALPKVRGKNLLNVIHGLVALGDAQSADAFREALKDPDREVRIAAGAGLAKVGDASASDSLVKAADVAAGWERVQATKHCMILAEKLAAAGKKDQAAKIYQHLRETRKDASEKYIRDAAEKALAGA